VVRTNLVGMAQDTKWFCEGGVIYVLVSRWKFREYFTPEWVGMKVVWNVQFQAPEATCAKSATGPNPADFATANGR
jgi:hypothetical protein